MAIDFRPAGSAPAQSFQSRPEDDGFDFRAAPDDRNAIEKVRDFGIGAVDFINNNPVSKGLVSLAALPVQATAKAFGLEDPYKDGIGGGGPFKPVGVTPSEGSWGEYGSKQVGNALSVGSMFVPLARGASVITAGAKMVPGLSRFAPAIGNVGIGAGTGYAADVGMGLQEGEEEPFNPGLGTAFGAGIPGAGYALKAAGNVLSHPMGAATGVGSDVLKEAFKATAQGGAASRAFWEGLGNKFTPEQLVEQARSTFSTILKNRSDGYQKMLGTMKQSTAELDPTPIARKLSQELSNYGIKVTDQGLDFGRSTLPNSDQAIVREIYNDVMGWGSQQGDLTAQGIDILKRRISNYFSQNRDVRGLVASVRSSAREVLEQHPGYDDAMRNYTEATEMIDDIRKALSLGHNTGDDTVFRKLTLALRTNNEFRAEMLRQLDEAGGSTLLPRVAGQQLSELMPRGLMRQGVTGLVGGGAIFGGIPWAGALAALAVTSPKLVGTIIGALGVSKGVAQRILQKLVPTSPGDALFTGRNSARAAQKAGVAPEPEMLALPPGRADLSEINQGRPIQVAAEGQAIEPIGNDVMAGRYTPPKAPGGNPKPLEYDTEVGNVYDGDLPVIEMGRKPSKQRLFPTIDADRMSPPNVGAGRVPRETRVGAPDQGWAARQATTDNVTVLPPGGVPGGAPARTRASQKGSADIRTILGTAGLLGAGAAGAGIGSIPGRELTYERSPEAVQPQEPQGRMVERILSAIAYNESRGEAEPYRTRTPSGIKAYGDALGKYQVLEAELSDNAEKFLGERVSAEAFVQSPTLQERYMQAKVKFLLDEGLSLEDILAVHRRGMTGYGNPEVLEKKRGASAGYIDAGKRSLEELINQQ